MIDEVDHEMESVVAGVKLDDGIVSSQSVYPCNQEIPFRNGLRMKPPLLRQTKRSRHLKHRDADWLSDLNLVSKIMRS